MSHEKTERNNSIIKAREYYKHTLKEIASVHSISISRVYQIVGKRQHKSWWSRLLQRLSRSIR